MKSQPSRHPRRATRRKDKKPRRGNSVAAVSQAAPCSGVLECHPQGYGFLRRVAKNLARRNDDVFVPESTVQTYQLRSGVFVSGVSRLIRREESPRLVGINDINGIAPKSYADVVSLEGLDPHEPDQVAASGA